MATLTISLPDELKQFVDQQVAAHGYGSSSEYLCELIGKQRDAEEFRGMLLDGPESGPVEPVTPDTFERMRTELRARSSGRYVEAADVLKGLEANLATARGPTRPA